MGVTTRKVERVPRSRSMAAICGTVANAGRRPRRGPARGPSRARRAPTRARRRSASGRRGCARPATACRARAAGTARDRSGPASPAAGAVISRSSGAPSRTTRPEPTRRTAIAAVPSAKRASAPPSLCQPVVAPDGKPSVSAGTPPPARVARRSRFSGTGSLTPASCSAGAETPSITTTPPPVANVSRLVLSAAATDPDHTTSGWESAVAAGGHADGGHAGTGQPGQRRCGVAIRRGVHGGGRGAAGEVGGSGRGRRARGVGRAVRDLRYGQRGGSAPRARRDRGRLRQPGHERGPRRPSAQCRRRRGRERRSCDGHSSAVLSARDGRTVSRISRAAPRPRRAPSARGR